jgi:hypothetical protein
MFNGIGAFVRRSGPVDVPGPGDTRECADLAIRKILWNGDCEEAHARRVLGT